MFPTLHWTSVELTLRVIRGGWDSETSKRWRGLEIPAAKEGEFLRSIFDQDVLIGSSQAKYEALVQIYLQADALVLISGEKVMNGNPNQVIITDKFPLFWTNIQGGDKNSTFSLIDHILNHWIKPSKIFNDNLRVMWHKTDKAPPGHELPMGEAGKLDACWWL